MPSLEYTPVSPINSLADFYASGQAQNQVNTGRQDLADRATLRGLAPDLANRDPGAIAGAAVLPVGTGTVNSLSGMDSAQAAARLAQAQFDASRFTYPGATPAAGSPPPGSQPGADFTTQMGNAEAPGPGAVNRGGYSGQFQFGAARLADPGVGVYTPAQGEDTNANTWQGTFNIPGFPNVKTHADFLANPEAQKAVFATHVADIDKAIAATPGTDKLNQNGLRAVAHLGGVAGMQRFVSSGGLYDPADANGVRLSDYYTKFSQGGPRALQASFGHPDGPPAPAAASAPAPIATTDQAEPGRVQVASLTGTPGQPITANDASPQAAPGRSFPEVMVGLRGGQAAAPSNDAPPPGWDANGVPLPKGWMDAEKAGQAAAPAVPNPNGLLPGAVAPAPAPQNGLMPGASAAPPAAPSAPGETVDFSRNGQGQYNTAGLPAGMAEARVTHANGSVTFEPRMMPGIPQPIEYQKTEDSIIGINKLTGQVVSRVPITSSARVTQAQGMGPLTGPDGKPVLDSSGKPVMVAGTVESQNGRQVGFVPAGGRPEQNEAYKADLATAHSLTSAAQSSQGSMPRLNEMAQIASELSTGGALPETRAKAAAFLESMGASPETMKALTGMSSGSAAQLFTKLAISTAGAAAKTDVGSNNGIQSLQLYQSANPGMNLLPDANTRVTNMLRVAAQQTQDYAQAALQHFGENESRFLGGGAYSPLTTFNRQWLAQSNPQIGAAAMGILNGDSFESWKAKLTPEQGAQAAAMVARIDPTAMVPVKGGSIPVQQLLAHSALPKAPR